MRVPILFAALLAPALLLAACGGGGGNDGSAPTPPGTPLSDADYVRGLCSGIDAWVQVALTKTEDEMRTAVGKLIDDTSALSPPLDARDFQDAFLKYLEDRRDTPTLLLTDAPPMPAADVRVRLSAVERATPECKTPLFARESPSATPGG